MHGPSTYCHISIAHYMESIDGEIIKLMCSDVKVN